MNLGDLVEQVAGNIGRTDKGDNIKRLLNQYMKGIARTVRLAELDKSVVQQFSADVVSYNFNLNWHKLISITYADVGRLQEILPSDMINLKTGRLAITARPEWYCVLDQKVEVYPKPDRTYPVNVVYSSWPAELVQNGDIPSIVDCEDILIAAATFESFLSLQQTDEASLWLKLYVSRLEDFKLDRQNRPGWTPGRVRIPATGYAGDPLRDPFVRRMP